MLGHSTSPKLDTYRQAHCEQVKTHLKHLMQQSGPIPFKQYMHEVLYAPNLGYYRVGLPKLGQTGDFVTAPEISPLFSQTLAAPCAQVLCSLNQGKILEMGAGQGVMAADLLLALEKLNCLPAAYCILEVSAELKHRQYITFTERAPHLLNRVHWLDQWPEVFSGVVLANEVLDAMPVHLFHYDGKAFQEYWVNWNDQALQWQLGPLSESTLLHSLQSIEPLLPPNYTSEINPALNSWLDSLARTIHQGFILMIDYGFPQHEYYHPQRHMGTLMCHLAHHAHQDPLAYPGVQDITAHVDFTAVGEAALKAGLEVIGFTTQSDFLINCGLLEHVPNDVDAKTSYQINQQIKLLTHPAEMGELFKVMGLSKNLDLPWIGFQNNDQRYRLG